MHLTAIQNLNEIVGPSWNRSYETFYYFLLGKVWAYDKEMWVSGFFFEGQFEVFSLL